MSEKLKVKADILQNKGVEQAEKNDLKAAIQSWEQALIVYNQIDDRDGKGNALGNLGVAHHFLGNYQQAITYHQQSLALELEVSSSIQEQLEADNKSDNYQFGEYTSKRQVGTSKSLGYIRFSLGFTYYWLNNYTQAIEQYELSLAIAQASNDSQNRVIVLAQIGEVYFYLGKYLKSIDYHRQAVQIAENIKDFSGQGNSLNSIGNAYSKLGQWEKAKQYYQTALPLLKEIDNLNGQGNALGGIGIALSNQNNHSQALDYFEQCLKLFQEINNPYNSGRAFNLLGQAYYFLGDYERAIDYHQRSLAISQELQEVFSEEKARSDLGLCFYKSDRSKLAEEHLLASIRIVESIRSKLGNDDELKISIFDRQTEPYQLLQAVLIAQNKLEQALQISERGRARAFIELLAKRSELLESTPASIEFPSIDLIEHIAKKQNATLVEYSLIQTRGLEEAKLYIWVINSHGRVNFKVVNLEIIQSQKLLLLDLVVQARESLGIKEILLRDSNTSDDIQLLLTTEYDTKPLQKLYQYLIQPIIDFLPAEQNTSVIFIPQGDLFLVPFAALQNPKTQEYLIEKYTISTAPSIQTLELTEQISSSDKKQSNNDIKALVVGNPAMPFIGEPPEQLKALPAATVEANAISLLVNTKALIREEATKVKILQQLPQADIIHFATHGLLDDIRKMGIPGAIAFAPQDEDDGFLTSGEIMKMFGMPDKLPLVAKLIVLSACATGLGKITGDGVVGLSRSLMAAGINTLVVSLWSVNDLSTTFLMCKFYERLLLHMDVGQAIQEAQNWLRNVTKEELKQYIEDLPFDKKHKRDFRLNVLRKIKGNIKPFASPFYWAAFSTIGQQKISI